MSDHKAGVVAAAFPKSEVSKSESGKKLQSLFKEFYGKNKSEEGGKSNQVSNKMQKNKKFNDPKFQSVDERFNKIGKGKKRKFANLNSSNDNGDSDLMQHEKKKVKKQDVDYENLQTAADKIKKKEAGITNSLTLEEKCFPRNKKQKGAFVKKPISFLNNSLRKKQTLISEEPEGEENSNKAYDFSNAKLKFSPLKLGNKNKNNLQDNIFNESSNENFENDSTDYKKSKKDSNLSKRKFQNLDSVPGKGKKRKEIKKQEIFNVDDLDESDNAQKERETFVKNKKLSESRSESNVSTAKLKSKPFKLGSKNKNNLAADSFNESNESINKNFENDSTDYKKSKKVSNLSKTKFQNVDSVPGKGQKKKEIKKQEVFDVNYSGESDNATKECETFVKSKKLSEKKIQNIDDQAFNSKKSPEKDKNVDQNESQSESNMPDEESFKNNVEGHKGKKNKKLSKKKNKKKSKKVGNDEKSMEFQNETTASDSEKEQENLNELDETKMKNTSSPVNVRNKKESEDFISLSANDEPEENRTVSVGNLPKSSPKKILYKLFLPFGPIEKVRLRGAIPVKPNIPMKVAEITENFHSNMHNLRGFVTFKERSSALESLILNGTVVNDRHIFVDLAGAPGEKKAYDEKRSIFVGNLPFDVEEEAIWSTFSHCGLIDRIRVVRDRATGAGKGIAYIMFRNIESKEKALTLEDVEIGGRALRIKPVESSSHKKEKNAHSSKSPLNSFKSKAIRMKRNLDRPNSRKTVKKMEKKIKNLHRKKKIASQFKNMI